MLRAVANPQNPWHCSGIDWDGEYVPTVKLQVFEEQARSILSQNRSPDIAFRWSLNPYRGCYHGCTYCYARPTHQYLDWGAGTDFERKIVVKLNAPDLLRKALRRPGWKQECIAFSGITDCYQPLEASYGLTRQCLEVCLEHRTPVAVITKGASVLCRDIDLLSEMSRHVAIAVYLSIPFVDDATGRQFEPYASLISKRFSTLAKLAAAGIPTGIAVAPVIPGANDHMIPEILVRAREAGAQKAFMTLLRLPSEVRPVFLHHLHANLPLRANKVTNALRGMRNGSLNNSTFGARMRGEGNRWQMIERLFTTHCRRLGLQH